MNKLPQFILDLPEHKRPTQWIVCAANLYDGNILVTGARHCDSIMISVIERLKIKNTDKFIQGFIDQWGTFLTRQEAWNIATLNGQIRKHVGGDDANGGTLYSENLY